MQYILYTLREGGKFHIMSFGDATEAEYSKAKNLGKLVYHNGDKYVEKKIYYIALLNQLEDYDFVTKESR